MKIKASKKQATEITLVLNAEEAEALVVHLHEYEPCNSALTSRQDDLTSEIRDTIEEMLKS